MGVVGRRYKRTLKQLEWEQTDRQTDTQDNYSNPAVHARRGLMIAIVHSHSVDPQKLCVGIKYYIVHMYSMPYYAYGSTANLLFLGPTVLIYRRTGNVCERLIIANCEFFPDLQSLERKQLLLLVPRAPDARGCGSNHRLSQLLETQSAYFP